MVAKQTLESVTTNYKGPERTFKDIDMNLTRGSDGNYNKFLKHVADKYNSKEGTKKQLAEELHITGSTIDTVLKHAQDELGIQINKRKVPS